MKVNVVFFNLTKTKETDELETFPRSCWYWNFIRNPEKNAIAQFLQKVGFQVFRCGRGGVCVGGCMGWSQGGNFGVVEMRAGDVRF